MKNIDLKAFRKANNISQVELAEYLGIGQSFISQIEKGTRPIPPEYISKLSANQNWNCSMLIDKTLSGMDRVREQEPVSQEQLRSTVLQVMEPAEKFHIEYLERKVNDQESLIRELYKQIGILEEKLDSARKGETASHVDTSSAAHVG